MQRNFVGSSPDGAGVHKLTLSEWFVTPQGRYVLDWELAQFDLATEDCFGFHAVQIGMPETDFLRGNRIPFRFTLALEPGASLAADPLQLPLASQSLDLVALPHVLESCADPHQVLREVERALMPEGQVVISGFNPVSLWRLRQSFAARDDGAPWDARYIGLVRLKDWLKLLGLELNGGKFGRYAPPFASERWLERFAFMEDAGARWWPIAGGVYVVRAVKRVPGLRIVTPAWRKERARRRALAAIPRNGHAKGVQRAASDCDV